MTLSFPQLLAGVIGALLIYSAIKGETPIEVVQKAMRGNAVTAAGNKPVNGPPVAEATPGTPGEEIPKAARYN